MKKARTDFVGRGGPRAPAAALFALASGNVAAVVSLAALALFAPAGESRFLLSVPILAALCLVLSLAVTAGAVCGVRLIARRAFLDPLTLLPARQRIEAYIESRIGESDRKVSGFSLVGIQILNDTQINAMLGIRGGDRVLREIAARLRSWTDGVLMTGRWSGSLFFSVVGSDDFLRLDSLCRSLLAALSAPCAVDGKEMSVLFTVTVTRYPDDAATADDLVRNIVSLQDKGRSLPGELIFFNQEKMRREQREYSLMESLFRANLDEQMAVMYQPKIRFADGVCTGAEALIRWTHPDLGPVSPADFIPMAERRGLMRKLTRWVIGRVARDLSALSSRFPFAVSSDGLTVAVNLSVQDLKDEDLIPFMAREVEKTGLPPSCFEFEITEGVLVDDNPWIKMNLEHLRELGFKIAIDDFGTGYSSLSYLHRLNVQNLKIDQSFVRLISETSAKRGFPVIDAIISMGKSLGLELTAEGVETGFQADYLRDRGCDTAQGWLYSKALPFGEYLDFVEGNRKG